MSEERTFLVTRSSLIKRSLCALRALYSAIEDFASLTSFLLATGVLALFPPYGPNLIFFIYVLIRASS